MEKNSRYLTRAIGGMKTKLMKRVLAGKAINATFGQAQIDTLMQDYYNQHIKTENMESVKMKIDAFKEWCEQQYK